MSLNLATMLRESSKRHPDKTAIHIGDVALSYGMIDGLAQRFASALRGLGVKPGQHVALFLPNVPQFTIAYFGCHYAGNPVVPLNVLLTADEIAYHLEDAEAVAVVVWEGFLEQARVGFDRVHDCKHLLVVRADRADLTAPPGARNFTALSGPARLPVRDALIAALGRPEPAVAGAAADATALVLAVTGTTGEFAALAAAVIARVDAAAGDAELTATLLAAITAAKLDGLPLCQRLATDASPALRGAARACITALTGTDPGPRAGVTAPVRPPIDPDVGLRATGAWRLTTTAGDLVIGLEATIAPWHVATIITLTRTGYYDGLLFHRVVPDFVVQGGDPTGTGWGGPGFTLPSETTAALEAIPVGYDVGSVGIADAGKDTGGSQWFAMHSPAPHLEGRYTWVGRVIEGADVLDRIQVGVGDRLDLMAHVDVGREDGDDGLHQWLAGAAYARYRLRPTFELAGRVDGVVESVDDGAAPLLLGVDQVAPRRADPGAGRALDAAGVQDLGGGRALGVAGADQHRLPAVVVDGVVGAVDDPR